MILEYCSCVVATGNLMLALSVLQTLHVAYECNCVIISSVLTWCSLETVSCLLMKHTSLTFMCSYLFRHYLHSVSEKNPPAVSDIFPKLLGDLVQILHASCRSLTTLDYKFLFNYLQIWRSYSILRATNHRAFRPIVDILSIWWWSRLIWHNFVKVADNWIQICSPA